MRLFMREKRWLLSVAVAFSMLSLAGCGGDENPANGGGGGGGGGTPGPSLSYDGQQYKTVVIGGKTWMAENLNYATSSGSWCYDDDNSNCVKYGRLYDWEAATTVCPSGWHLPSRVEWGELAKAAGGTGDYGADNTASETPGNKLKSTSGWNDKGNGKDAYGFSALPGGARFTDGSFGRVGDAGGWWTATEGGSGNAYFRYMNYGQYVYEFFDLKENGFSVRCLRD